ncbi:MAG: hypothetical protein HY202_04690 [Nitrospirae bacterium]|nr:hypothetical protein [Nitrospirota bacterium]
MVKSLKIFLVVLLVDIGLLAAESIAKESLNPVSVKTIRLTPDAYDGKTLKVSGQVRSVTPGRGKRGSEFLIVVIEGPPSKTDETSPELTVFSYFAPPLKVGTPVIVLGVYHKSGRWAGSDHDHFIEAIKITPVELN